MHELTLHGPEEKLDVAEALCFDIVGPLALSRLAGLAENYQTQCGLPPYMPNIPPEEEAHSPVQECTHEDQKVEETLHDEEGLPRKKQRMLWCRNSMVGRLGIRSCSVDRSARCSLL